MTLHEFLGNILGLQVLSERDDLVTVAVPREKFANVIDELVNARGFAAQTDGEVADKALTGIGFSLAHLFATDDRQLKNTFGLHGLLHDDSNHTWILLSTQLPADDPTYPAVTRKVLAAHWYERWLADMFGIVPLGHPDPRRLVHHENFPEGIFPLRKDFAWDSKLEKVDLAYPMQVVNGDGVFEVPVGPIHAGIIEPGHFRFNVAGERILNLEGKLFFTHKGIEKILEGKTIAQAQPLVERISGDSAVAHALAFAQAVEILAKVEVTEHAKILRTLLNELERVTMHIHDLANMGGMGTGYTVIAAQGFRVLERLKQLSFDLFKNRFWRGVIVPGGLNQDISISDLERINIVVSEAVEEMQDIVKLALRSDGWRDRMETTGVLSKKAAEAYGAVGVAARASGVDRDMRRDHPYAAYQKFVPIVTTRTSGDVFARFMQRVSELNDSQRLIQEICQSKTAGNYQTNYQLQDGRAVGVCEGWRGEVVHVVFVKNNLIERLVVRDPSFCNWPLFAEIGPGNIIPDFPLCNKSLNLSYSGTDL
jgi:Ni,Fe-hydrogenase III large subunit/Ni,Fe-hydrogenase III component G